LWCGEVAVVTRDVSARDVRRAATPGRVGVVLAHVQPATAGACAALGQALAEAYADATLPAGPPASLTFTSRWLPGSGQTFAEGSQGQLLLIFPEIRFLHAPTLAAEASQQR
jgi:hypothetical protein